MMLLDPFRGRCGAVCVALTAGGWRQAEEEAEVERREAERLQAILDSATEERRTTEERCQGEVEATEVFRREATLRMEKSKADQQQAVEEEARFHAEEVHLRKKSQHIDRYNQQLAERIVRNEQFTKELQRRAKRARQLSKDALRIIERLLLEAKVIHTHREIDSPAPYAANLTKWPPVQTLLEFRGKLDRLTEIFQHAAHPHVLMAAMPEFVDPSVEAPKLQDTSDLLQSVWPEDFERLNRLRREFAEAEDWDNRATYRPPRTASPLFNPPPPLKVHNSEDPDPVQV